MPDYRRSYDGNTWFFTLITGQRRAILCDDRLRSLVRQAKPGQSSNLKGGCHVKS